MDNPTIVREVFKFMMQKKDDLSGSEDIRNFGHSDATLLRKGHRPYFKTKEFTRTGETIFKKTRNIGFKCSHYLQYLKKSSFSYIFVRHNAHGIVCIKKEKRERNGRR